MFGRVIIRRRRDLRITLREICIDLKLDPVEWSRIEQEIIAPPQSLDELVRIAEYLRLDPKYVIDMAEEDEDIVCVPLTDEELVPRLPIIFRTIDGKPLNEEKLMKFAEYMRAQGKGVRRHEVS